MKDQEFKPRHIKMPDRISYDQISQALKILGLPPSGRLNVKLNADEVVVTVADSAGGSYGSLTRTYPVNGLAVRYGPVEP